MSHWSCLCSSYRAPHSVEEKRGSWQEQGHTETLAEVWSRRVSVASAQSSPFSGPPGVDLEAMNAPGGRGDASTVTSTATTLLEQRLTRIISCLSKQLVVSILHLPCTGHSSLSYHCLRCPPREGGGSSLCLCFQVHSGSFGKPQFLPIDLNLNFLEKLHGERLGSHLLAEAWGLAAVRPPLWTEFPLDRPGAPLPLLTLQGEG